MFGDVFAGKVVVVTGGTRGIGWRCAERFGQHGARVLACGNDALQVAEARRRGATGVQVAAMDVRLEDDVRDVFCSSELLADGVDVLVNCAGIQHLGSVVDTDLATWNEVMDVNVTGAYLASRYAIPGMCRRGGGVIIHVASVHARLTAGRRAAYVASKSALVGLTRAMALDHGPDNIRVNVVSPGAIDTPMIAEAWKQSRPDKTLDEMRALACQVTPIGRLGTADDVAATILFLCSAAAGFVTGAEIAVDGGIGSKLALPVSRPEGS
jgi:NAD(P)-dependent dehydrogenase (short-subunit alcohol dehydrogenase family)